MRYLPGASAAVGISALALAATAQGNVAVACDADPANVRVTTSGHPAGAPIVATLSVNGAVRDRRTLAEDGSYVVPVADGATVQAETAQYGLTFPSNTLVKRCATGSTPGPPSPGQSPGTPGPATGPGPAIVVPGASPSPRARRRPPERCVADAKLTIRQPGRTTHTRTYRGTITVRNTTGRAIRNGRLIVAFGPLQYGVKGGARAKRLGWPINLRPGGTTSRGYVFGHPRAALDRHVTVRARLAACGRTVATATDTLFEG